MTNSSFDFVQLGDFAVYRQCAASSRDEALLDEQLRAAGFVVAAYDLAPAEQHLYQESAYDELFVVVSGEIFFYAEGKAEHLFEGDAFCTKARSYYGYANRTSQAVRMLVGTKTR